MRIAIDARAYSWAGIGRYTRNLLAQYAALETAHEFVVLLAAEDEKAFREEFGDHFEVVLVHGSYYSLQEQTTFLWQLNNVDAELFHFTHFNVPLFFKRPFVVTIHDVTRFFFPGQTRQGLFKQMAYEHVLARAVRRARRVVCVSEATRRDLLLVLQSQRDDIVVVHEGVEEKFAEPVPEELRKAVRRMVGERDYFLSVGVWMGHKNLERLLRAYRIVSKKKSDTAKLVVTGVAKPGFVDVGALVREHELEQDVVLPGYVDERLLPALYAEARALVFPSLYEGFGLPALEAAAAGCPVVTSNVSSMPEILGDSAMYVNPEDEEDIAAGMLRVGGQSVGQAWHFSWRDCAEQTLALYQ